MAKKKSSKAKASKADQEQLDAEAAELAALEEDLQEEIESDLEEEALEEVEEVDEPEEAPAPKTKKKAKKAPAAKAESGFRFEAFTKKGSDKVYYRVFHNGEIQNYIGLKLVNSMVKQTLEALAGQDAVRTLIPLGIGETKGSRAAHYQAGYNGVGFLMPKGVYLDLPESLSDILTESFNQTAEVGLEYMITGEENDRKTSALI